jgi:iron complex outermembrane receptor protein
LALLDPIGKIDASLSYLHARYVDFQTTPTIGAIAETAADGCGNQVPVYGTTNGVKTQIGTNCQLGGNRLTQAPDLTVSLGFEHTWTVPNGDKVNYRIEGKFTSKQYFDPFNLEDAEQGSYAVGNMYADYKHDNWSVGLFCRNFTDRTYLTYAAEATGGNSAEYDYGYGAPLTFGVRFQVALKQ